MRALRHCLIWVVSMIWLALAGCGPSTRLDPPSTVAPRIGQPPAVLEAPDSPPEEDRPASQASLACAEVHLGLDLRALPTNTTPEGIDMWVRGQAWDLQEAASGEPAPRTYVMQGAGSVHGQFDAPTESGALARCEQALAAYLPTAPNLPLIGSGSAAHVIVPCRPCEEASPDA